MSDIGRIWIDDSIQGMYKAGDFVDIDISVKSHKYDGVYAFQLGEDKFISHLQFIPNEGVQVLLKNYGHENFTITDDMDFKVIGKIVKGWVVKI